MAASAAEMKYAINGTYGSAALDFSRLPGYAAPEEEIYDIPQETPKERPRERVREHERVRERERAGTRAEAIARAREVQSVSVGAVIGFAVAAVLMVLVLLSYVRLAEISAEVSALNSAISELEIQQAELKVQYESVFNLNEVKEYATSVLGMTKLTDANTTVLTMERLDKAEILAKDDISGLGFISTAKEFISSLAEYFR